MTLILREDWQLSGRENDQEGAGKSEDDTSSDDEIIVLPVIDDTSEAEE